jgi:predicted ribosome quality control (RQC) complex YloA/Tae2 family protein
MNNYYALIYLLQDLKEKITGGIFKRAISPHKNVLEIFVEFSNEARRLVFSTNPDETALFVDAYRPAKKSNVIDFFEPLRDKKIIDCSIADYDRLIYIHFEDQSSLQFKLFSRSPNLFLVREETVVDAFKHPDRVKNKKMLKPEIPDFKEESSPRRSAKNQILELNPLMPRNLLPYLVEQHRLEEAAPEEIKAFVRNLTAKLEKEPVFRVLKTGEVCLWDEELLNIETEKEFETANACIRHAYRTQSYGRRVQQKKQVIRQKLQRKMAKLESRLDQLEQADKSLGRADKYEKYGHLLMAHAHESPEKGNKSLEVNDLYEPGSQLISIPLQDDASIAESANYYYEKAKNARKSYKEATRRLPAVRRQLEEVERYYNELQEIQDLTKMDDWVKKHETSLQEMGVIGEAPQESSPFRKLKAGKYEIWIGKNAKSNDALLQVAHKEDIWLHARGVPGSHVIIRMGNRKEYPPREILLMAAGYAAHYSKAQGMRTAPVMISKRKYVRKPKGADPGTVVVERERVEMVPPVNPKNNPA